MRKNEERSCDLLHVIKSINFLIAADPEENREKGAESLFYEIMAGNLPNLGSNLNIQVHEAHRSPT